MNDDSERNVVKFSFLKKSHEAILDGLGRGCWWLLVVAQLARGVYRACLFCEDVLGG